MQIFSLCTDGNRRCFESGWVVFGINPSPIKATIFLIVKYVTNHRGEIAIWKNARNFFKKKKKKKIKWQCWISLNKIHCFEWLMRSWEKTGVFTVGKLSNSYKDQQHISSHTDMIQNAKDWSTTRWTSTSKLYMYMYIYNG